MMLERTFLIQFTHFLEEPRLKRLRKIQDTQLQIFMPKEVTLSLSLRKVKIGTWASLTLKKER